MSTVIGCNTFPLKEELSKDFEGTLRKLKDIGFDVIEPIIWAKKTQGNVPASIWSKEYLHKAIKLFDEIDLGMQSAHVGVGFCGITLPIGSLKKNILEINNLTGIKSFVSSAVFSTKNGAVKYAKTMRRLAEELEPYGIEILLHNHDDEFTKLKGEREKCALDVYFENVGENVGIELDVGWASLGSGDEIKIAEKYADKIKILHMKDFFESGKEKDRKSLANSDFAPIGEGFVKSREIIEKRSEFQNFENYIVIDQDHSGGNIFDDLEKGIKNLKDYLK